MNKTDTAISLTAGSIRDRTDLLIQQTEALRRERQDTKREAYELIAPLSRALELLTAQNQTLAAENARLGRDVGSVGQLLKQQLEVWERLLSQQAAFSAVQEKQLADLNGLLKQQGSKPSPRSGLL